MIVRFTIIIVFLYIFFLQARKSITFGIELLKPKVMEKKLKVLVLFIALLFSNVITGSEVSHAIILYPQIIDPTGLQGPLPKSPILIPEVSLDGHTLYIGTAFSDDIDVQLVSIDEVTGNETVVYSTVLYAGDQTIVFPSTLSGTYELRLIVDWYYLAGEVEL